MPSWFDELSIRNRIILLMLAILLPAAGTVAWLLAADLRHAREAAQAKVQILVAGTTTGLRRQLAQAETVLSRLAARPLVRSLDPGNCDPIVA